MGRRAIPSVATTVRKLPVPPVPTPKAADRAARAHTFDRTQSPALIGLGGRIWFESGLRRFGGPDRGSGKLWRKPVRLPYGTEPIPRGMPQNLQQPVYPAPSHTALWLARVSIALLIGTSLWLLGLRTREDRRCVDSAGSVTAEMRSPEPKQ
jgi:hypothetical protein